VNLERLVELVAGRHDDEDVHVAVFMRRAVSIGAEQDDLVGPEALGHLAREAADHVHRDIRPEIPARRFRGAFACAFGGHVCIERGEFVAVNTIDHTDQYTFLACTEALDTANSPEGERKSSCGGDTTTGILLPRQYALCTRLGTPGLSAMPRPGPPRRLFDRIGYHRTSAAQFV